jgi:small-conductance mechanosensitive channel
MALFEQFKTIPLFGNTAYDYLVAVIIFITLLVILKIFQVIILARLRQLAKKTRTDFDDALIEIFTKIKPPFYFFIALYFALRPLTVIPVVNTVIKVLVLVAIVYEVIRAIERLISYFISKTIDQGEEPDQAQKEAMLKTLRIVVSGILWLIGLLLILSNLGINVNSLIASLGIGGIAIALAVQNILGDLFSSFSIYLDKPFQVGDFIVVGEYNGTVERIGLKTTRLRTLQGEELVIANKELTSSRIQNFKRMEKRRVVFSLGIVYGTKIEKLKKIPAIITEVFEKIDQADLDRCHFESYGDFSLNYQIVFFVNSAAYNDYMDIRQAINLEIYDRFAKEKIEFAYPTQTVIVQKP